MMANRQVCEEGDGRLPWIGVLKYWSPKQFGYGILRKDDISIGECTYDKTDIVEAFFVDDDNV